MGLIIRSPRRRGRAASATGFRLNYQKQLHCGPKITAKQKKWRYNTDTRSHLIHRSAGIIPPLGGDSGFLLSDLTATDSGKAVHAFSQAGTYRKPGKPTSHELEGAQLTE